MFYGKSAYIEGIFIITKQKKPKETLHKNKETMPKLQVKSGVLLIRSTKLRTPLKD
jgi:hypothetical protein